MLTESRSGSGSECGEHVEWRVCECDRIEEEEGDDDVDPEGGSNAPIGGQRCHWDGIMAMG